MKDCSVLHLEQQLCHAIKSRHFSRSTYVHEFSRLEIIILKEIHGFCDTKHPFTL